MNKSNDKPIDKSQPIKEKAKQTLLKVTEATELLPFLISQFPGKSRSSIKAWLTHRQVSINYKIVLR